MIRSPEGEQGQLFSLEKVAHLTGADVPEGHHLFEGVASLIRALPSHITFFDHPKQKANLALTQAGACFIHPRYANWLPQNVIPLLTERPRRAFLTLAHALLPQASFTPGKHTSAVIHPTAYVPDSCFIGAGVVISAEAQLGEHCVVGPLTVIGEKVTLGNHCRLESHVTLCHARVGNHVFIKTGTRIGQTGFGFMMDEEGWLDVPHLGLVILEDHVEIGANCTIDRGSFDHTVIGAYSRLDNLVQVAHNVTIGRKVVVVAQCGIAGGCMIGDGCILGGQVGLADHVSLAPGTQVAAKSGVMRSTHTREILAGIPAMPAREWRKQSILKGFRRVQDSTDA